MNNNQASTQQKLLIVGNGMAAGRMVDELIARDPHRFSITVIGDEPHGSYNRIMLSPVLSGESTALSIIQKPAAWYAENGMRFLAGVKVVRINRAQKTVDCDNGEQVEYDHLIMATGSRPARIPAKNQDLTGVMAFRTLDDVDTILALGETAKHAIVIGGGLLGLEAAYGMAVRGIDVTLVHRSGWLLNRQLDSASGALLEQVMAHKGVRFRLSREVVSFNGNRRVESATLTGGETLPCDIAVIATGITPNAELGFEAGLEGKRGIEVNDYLATSDPAISAIGECSEHNGETFGLVEPIWQHCTSLADRLALNVRTAYKNMPVATKLKVSGVQVFSAGDWLTTDQHREVVYQDVARNIYRKLLLKNNRIVGIVFFGDVRDGQYFFELMEHGVVVTQALPQLLMGRAFCSEVPQAAASKEVAAA
ncbi:NAD(P)/FAD-dependent oxidoreductase [Marinagarivorans cellulosilyticus]|uniref:Nitrite reductase (NADH) large subunit n=1 Tax=Marinagarivorans cellulosilyticus TaxID=2721545 RepID=A0AAN1WG41_9GAMM|nr:FAD-dependent oxidoreductase [Marinagarivorans cellulosilyticus]BCD96968.1 nitrite reductase (NADH) large subunit [Marinagarivorans cellulosilyticus]